MKQGKRLSLSLTPGEIWLFGCKFEMDFATGCWLWTASIDKDGYGHFRCRGRCMQAHRVSYAHHVNNIPSRRDIDHRCQNRHCVNPEHLRLWTRAENAADADARRAAKEYQDSIESLNFDNPDDCPF